jgi:hypothetical protein
MPIPALPPLLRPPADLPFPDLWNIRIHRPVPGKPGEEKVFPVVLPSGTNAIGCEKNVYLEFGDVVEVPERDHALGEAIVGLTDDQYRELLACIARKVTFVAHGERVEVTLSGLDARLSHAAKGSTVQALLRSSSDLTRVQITRTDPETKQTRQLTENILPFWENKQPLADDLWLRDGDVIEVPDKP